MLRLWSSVLKAGFDETKYCRTEQQRQEFHIGLGYIMPPQEQERSQLGWIRRICELLGLRRGKRPQKYGARPYALNLKEVLPPELEAAARGGKRTRGAGLVRLEGMGRKRYILSPDVDTDLRSKCE